MRNSHIKCSWPQLPSQFTQLKTFHWLSNFTYHSAIWGYLLQGPGEIWAILNKCLLLEILLSLWQMQLLDFSMLSDPGAMSFRRQIFLHFKDFFCTSRILSNDCTGYPRPCSRGLGLAEPSGVSLSFHLSHRRLQGGGHGPPTKGLTKMKKWPNL